MLQKCTTLDESRSKVSKVGDERVDDVTMITKNGMQYAIYRVLVDEECSSSLFSNNHHVAPRNGIRDAGIPIFSGFTPHAPSSKHFPHARNVPVTPERMSPCPPQRLRPPGASTVVVCGSEEVGCTAMRSSAPF